MPEELRLQQRLWEIQTLLGKYPPIEVFVCVSRNTSNQTWWSRQAW